MKILIAEDDRHTREGLRELLEEEGYEVLPAADGGEALRLYQSGSPDLLCLDIMMPVKSGYDVCREIRRSDDAVPVLFLSAKSEEIDKVLGLELGADDFVSKPFGSREILARIKALLRRCGARNEPRNEPRNGTRNGTRGAAGMSGAARSQDEEAFRMGSLELIPEQLRARRGEHIIDLSEREMKILILLAENPGRVVDRNTLFDAAWGCSYIPESRTLDQTIAVLRKKIELDPSRPQIIKTVHGAGYRWE